MLTALYQIYDHPFLAVFIKEIITRLRKCFDGSEQDHGKMKNLIVSLCLLYNFDNFAPEFIIDLIFYLANKLNEGTLEMIMIILQNSGFTIRHNNPGLIKVFINI